MVEAFIEKSSHFSASALVTYYEAMIDRPDRRDILKQSKIPVMLIMSENDQAIPIADSLEQSSLPEKSYITILKNSGHMGMVEEPMESNQAISRFLEAC